jgi:uncharacterized protein YybS (DUF2232 family)
MFLGANIFKNTSIQLKQQTSAKIWRMPDYVLLKTVAILSLMVQYVVPPSVN